MGVILKVGRVSVVEKAGHYYLRASLPQSDGVGIISRWLSTGEKIGREGLERVDVLAKELDADLAKWKLGLSFPFGKWSIGSAVELVVDDYRQKLRLKLGLEEAEPVTRDTGNGIDERGNIFKQGFETKVRGQELANKLNQGWIMYLEIIKDTFSPTTYVLKERFGRNCLTKLTNLVANLVEETSEEEFNHSLVQVIKDELSTYERQKDFVLEVNRMIHVTGLDHPQIEWSSDRKQHKRKKRKEIDCFTREETQQIVADFLAGNGCRLRDTHSEYDQRLQRVITTGHYIRFCFMTGCRPEEAAGLRLEDVNPHGQIRFSQCLVKGKGSVEIKEGLKTQDFRLFPVNSQLYQALKKALDYRERIGKEGRKGEEELFFCFGGKGFHSASLSRDWIGCLARLGIRYRKPYCTRHTFITNCLAKGVPVATVAKWVGNSPEVIYKHYSASTGEDVPEF